MKTLGIVAVCVGGVEAFFSHLTRYSLRTYNSTIPEIMLHQIPIQDYSQAINSNKSFSLETLLLCSLSKLKRMGSEFAVIPNNTAHSVIQQIILKSPLPILNLLDVITKECRKKSLSNVLLLGTSKLIESRVYQDALNAQNIKVGLLKPEENQLMTQEIIEATNSGDLEFTFSSKIDKIIRTAVTHHNAVLLACSDLIKPYHHQFDIPTINPMTVLAQEAAKVAMEDLYF